MNEFVKKLRKEGYPYRIKGNGGYEAILCGVQPLLEGDYEAIYRYPGGECVHDLYDINFLVENGTFEIIEQ